MASVPRRRHDAAPDTGTGNTGSAGATTMGELWEGRYRLTTAALLCAVMLLWVSLQASNVEQVSEAPASADVHARLRADIGTAVAGDSDKYHAIGLLLSKTPQLMVLEQDGIELFSSHDLNDGTALAGVRRVLLLFHGCKNSASVWALGAPERVLLRPLLEEQQTLVIALSSSASRARAAGNGCWNNKAEPGSNTDVVNVWTILGSLFAANPSLRQATLHGLGVSSGGAFISLLATVLQFDSIVVYIAALHPQLTDALPPDVSPPAGSTRSQSQRTAFDASAVHEWESKTSPIPKELRAVYIPAVVFVHMPKDTGNADTIRVQRDTLVRLSVRSTVFESPPDLLFSPTTFRQHLPSRLSTAASEQLFARLKAKGAFQPAPLDSGTGTRFHLAINPRSPAFAATVSSFVSQLVPAVVTSNPSLLEACMRPGGATSATKYAVGEGPVRVSALCQGSDVLLDLPSYAVLVDDRTVSTNADVLSVLQQQVARVILEVANEKYGEHEMTRAAAQQVVDFLVQT